MDRVTRKPNGFYVRVVYRQYVNELAPGFTSVEFGPVAEVTAQVETGLPGTEFASAGVLTLPDEVWGALAFISSCLLKVIQSGEYVPGKVHDFRDILPGGEYIAPVTLSDKAKHGANFYLSAKGYRLVDPMALAEMATVIGLLKTAPDHPSIFPSGKWATIQALEGDFYWGEELAKREGKA